MGAAYAIGIASLNNLLLTAAWVAAAGMQGRVWGRPTWDAFKVLTRASLCALLRPSGHVQICLPHPALRQQGIYRVLCYSGMHLSIICIMPLLCVDLGAHEHVPPAAWKAPADSVCASGLAAEVGRVRPPGLQRLLHEGGRVLGLRPAGALCRCLFLPPWCFPPSCPCPWPRLQGVRSIWTFIAKQDLLTWLHGCAGLLPDPARSVASTSIAFNTWVAPAS